MAFKSLRQTGNLDSAFKVRALMRKMINHQLKKEITTQAHTAINGSCAVILKTFEIESFEKRIEKLELKFAKKKNMKRFKPGPNVAIDDPERILNETRH